MKAVFALIVMPLTACAAPPAVEPTGTVRQVPRITPVPDGFACDGQNFKIAFEEGVAYVTLPDGVMVALTRQRTTRGADPEAPRVFSNGHLSFTQEIEGGRAVRYATGRAAFLDCKRLP